MDVALFLLFMGGCFTVVGLAAAGFGWQQRKHKTLVTDTPTTEIRTLDSEGPVELQGTISEPTDGSGFVSPISQTTDAVFTTWKVEQWSADSDRDGSTWANIARGIDSVPFYLDDGTGQVRVEIGERSSDVTQEFDEVPIVEKVDVDSQPPMHIRTFEDENGLPERSGSSGTLLPSSGRKYGDRRYSEHTLTTGEDIYLLGHVRAAEGATMPLHPEDTVVAPTENETFLLSDLPEDELMQQLTSSYRTWFGFGAVFLLIGIGFLVAMTMV